MPAVILKLVMRAVPFLRLPFVAWLCCTFTHHAQLHTPSEERAKTVTAPDMFYWLPFVYIDVMNMSASARKYGFHSLYHFLISHCFKGFIDCDLC